MKLHMSYESINKCNQSFTNNAIYHVSIICYDLKVNEKIFHIKEIDEFLL